MKTPEENIINTLKGKKVLFLENDNSLGNGLDEFENILKRGKIKYKILYDISKVSLPTVLKEIEKTDAIVFMTQWAYPISKTLSEYMFASQDAKIVIEVYIYEPTWFYKPKSVHEVYVYTCPMHWGKPEKERERFYKLSEDPYWNYKNKFDK